MSKLLIIVLVLTTINFISGLPCPTGQISENDRCVSVKMATDKREFLDHFPDLLGETKTRKTRKAIVEKPECPPDYIWLKGKCRKISASQSGSTKCPPGQVFVRGRCQRVRSY
jgi:hypothetical protein